MTVQRSRARLSLPSPGQSVFIFLCGFSLILILRNSDIAIEYIGNGLKLCVRTVIPALFPFMVISELIVLSGLGDILGRFLDRPLGWIFGISGVSSCAVLLGAFCGFPIGARTAVALLDQGLINKKEASRLLTFCNNPSSAYLINAVGVSLYFCRKLGITLYIVTLINAFIIGAAQRFFCPKLQTDNDHNIRIYPRSINVFTDSVTRAANSMLIICAYVVFFSAILGCLSQLLAAFKCPPPLTAFIYGIVELSCGVSTSSSLGLNTAGVCLTAFIVGWSGISVHLQILSVCAGKGLNFRGYFAAKLIHGLLNSLIMFIICIAFPQFLSTAKSAVSSAYISGVQKYFITAVLITFVAALSGAVIKAIQNRHIWN